jgi:DNA-binding MarR family transcriptional regulator
MNQAGGIEVSGQMNDAMIQDLTERYIQCAHEVWKLGEAMVREEIGEQLTTDQLYILRYINQKQKVTSTELADVFCVQKSAITAMIARLAEKGLISRTQDSADRRIIYLTLTEEGKELFHKLQDRVFKITNSFISKFDAEEINHFIQTYEKLAKILREMR